MSPPRTSPDESLSDAGASSPSSAAPSPAATRTVRSHFFEDPGPAFDAGRAAEEAAPEPPPEPPALLDEFHEDQVRSLLEAQGAAVHWAVAVEKESDEWLYTKADLGAIAPPLTRILNRYDATRAMAGAADEGALVIGLTGYITRSYRARRAALARRAEAPPVPVSGHAAEVADDATPDLAPGLFTPPEPAGPAPPAQTIPDEETPDEWST